MKQRDLRFMLNGGKRVASLLLAAMLVLTGCGKKDSKEEEETASTTEATITEEPAEDVSYTDGTPWMNSDLAENITEGLETSAVDDFHLYSNYDWMLSSEIPEGYNSYSTFVEVYEDITANSLALLQDDSIDSHDAKLCQTLYNQYLDWDARNEQGMAPAEKVIDELEAIASIDDLNGYLLSEDSDIFVSAFISLSNEAGLNDSSSYVLYVDGIGFTLGGAEEYTERSAQGDAVYAAYQDLLVNLLGRIGYSESDAKTIFDNSIAFETKLAEVSYTSGDEMSSDYIQMINNPYTMDDFCDEFTNYPAEDLIDLFGYGDAKELCVANPDYFQKLDEVYVNENIEEIKDYLIVDYITSVASYLDRDAFDALVTASNAIYGSSGSTPDEENALNFVSSLLTEPLNRAYLEKYDCTQKKEDITEICNSVIETYREMLQQEDWLSDETKEKAIEKLDNITVNAVYPDKWDSDFSDLELSEDSFMESIELINSYLGDIDIAKTNGKVDTEVWGFDILETNAYYDPSQNSINIILGILDGAFYNEDMTIEEMYGGIGCIIGHEISHAFDTNGAQFDKDGNLSDWWTEEDYQAFEDRAKKLDDYYDGITVWGDVNVVGEYVETEAIADMTGMNAILNMAEDVEDFDYESFFTAYARLWRESTYQETENYYLTQDVHPLSYLRTNVTVQQFDEFYDTFDVKEGDNMYLAPEDRILVW